MEQREKALKEAERLLKQGRVQAALGKLQQFVAANPGDMPALNRVGDLLARQGRNEEAVDYYEKIAASFSEGGFIPKAIAIYKKILRLVPDHTESNIRLGELYLRQNLLGDARANLVRAADKLIAEEQFDEAQAVYEKLIAAMKRAESKMPPVLNAFRDQVLFMKHSLNARAIAALEGTVGEIESDVASLIRDIDASIKEAESFLDQFEAS